MVEQHQWRNYQIMGKRLFFLVFILGYSITSIGQDIFLKEYGEYIKPRSCSDSIIQYVRDSSFLKIKLLNCRGKMRIQEFDRNGKLLAAGQYEASLDTLKEYVDVFDLSGQIKAIKIYKYFQPLKDGVWIYYENGEIKKKEKYRDGILLKE